ncbi:hypothetical protein [Rhizobium sp. PL01]|uniref:hypothetical protein n=1 Tax=Rhizobium sp. PL01 TaxID=3085631 RepID=UPI0029825598|nr:hypothetical protein [Rhizobium sp. PL01]MDW5315081.1 hypothetical protein [Rhizobium sp. PL01]
MQIRINPTVLSNTIWHSYLDVVFDFVQHHSEFLTFDLSELNAVIRSAWLRNAEGTRALVPDMLRASALAASRSVPSDKITVHIDDSAPHEGIIEASNAVRIHPFGALIILAQPFHLIVEDESSDGSFILWMARLLGKDKIRKAYNSGRLLFRHAGGKGQITKSARALSYGVWPRDNKPIRTMNIRAGVILDSDAKFNGHSPNSQVTSSVAEYVAFSHILIGRTIENYVPRKYMERRLAADGLASMATSFFSLSNDERTYFPMKKGFRDENDSPQPHAAFLVDAKRPQQERDLYRNVSPAVWNVVHAGFGERLSSIYMENGYRCGPGETGQLTSTQKNEINDLLVKIIYHL